MKVRIETIEVDNLVRRAVQYKFGKAGKATRKEMKDEIESLIYAYLDNIVADFTER